MGIPCLGHDEAIVLCLPCIGDPLASGTVISTCLSFKDWMRVSRTMSAIKTAFTQSQNDDYDMQE